jgi:hypothetical protein
MLGEMFEDQCATQALAIKDERGLAVELGIIAEGVDIVLQHIKVRHAAPCFAMTAMIIAYDMITMLNEELCHRVISSGVFTEAMDNSDDWFVLRLRMGV